MAQKPGALTGSYPATKTTDQTDDFFGTEFQTLTDGLENDMAEDTKDWVQRQNKVTNAYLSKIPYRDAIKKRLTELWNYEKFSAPFKEGEYTYFYKNNGLQNQSVLYRQKNGRQPEIFLDPNTFSPDGTTSLAGIDFTKDGSLAAYQISEGGSDWRKVIIINTQTKKIQDDTLADVKFSGLSWHNNEGFYYSSYDKPKEGSQLSGKTQLHKLYFHMLGTPQSEDRLLFGGETIPRRYIAGRVTENQQYLVISAANATYGNELYIQDLTKPNAPIVSIVTGFENEQDVADAENGKLYISTNLNAPNRKLVVTNASTPTSDYWHDLIPEAKFPLNVSSSGGRFFAQYTKDAVSEIEEYTYDGKKIKTIALPGLGTASGFSGKKKKRKCTTLIPLMYILRPFLNTILIQANLLFIKSRE
ncbi:MAG: hypothetical protein WKG06_01415 [Segetibacter sp.]